MYIRKTDGPRTVDLPDGGRMTLGDLPPRGTLRWVAGRKAAVVRAISAGLVSRDWAIDAYDLSDEELDGWIEMAGLHGEAALRTTALKQYRDQTSVVSENNGGSVTPR
ncbi:MAG: CtrA inhibitor SciP [Hasllibacter sp.]